MTSVRIAISTLLVAAFVMAACGCPDRGEQEPVVEIISSPPPSVLAVATGEPDSEDAWFYVWAFPSGELVHSGPRSEILSIWAGGMLRQGEEGVEWLDLDRETLEYAADPVVELTSWEKPIAVSPKDRIIYAMGHTVPPLRSLRVYFLDGSDFEEVDQLTADVLEPFDMLTSSGWPMFFLDRPGQAGAATPEKRPTRRLRLYHEKDFGGEFMDVYGVYPLSGCVVVHSDEGWLFLEPGGYPAVVARTMSLGEIPGEIRALARDGDTILMASNSVDEEGEITTTDALYSYGTYTRVAEQIWTPSEPHEPVMILDAEVIGPKDYLMVTGSPSDLSELVLVRLKNGYWSELAKVGMNQPATDVYVFELGEIEVEAEEPVEVSAGEIEDVVTTDDEL